MEKYVITIAREYGSGGRGIAHRLAEALGIRYYDKELIRMASEDSGISEALFNLTDEKLEDKFLSKHGISKGALVSQPHPENKLTKEELFKFQSEIIRRVADQDESCIFCANIQILCACSFTLTRATALRSLCSDTESIKRKRLNCAKRRIKPVQITISIIQERSGEMYATMIYLWTLRNCHRKNASAL